MKKYILTEKQIASLFFFALIYIMVGSLVSIIGSRLGYLKPDSSFAYAMGIKDNLLLFVIAPILIVVKIAQLVGYLPKNKAYLDYYSPEEYPTFNSLRRYGKVTLGICFLLLVINFLLK